MLSRELKREMLEDAGSLRRKRSFFIGNKKAELFIKKHWGKPNIDDYLEFLNKTEKIGSFILPSRKITKDKDFRL